ncbi:MAG: hypothetical protein JW891_15365 [Candidatus Lokiarchaeota archaeon]|nr:hypothetical protein [Candidatus Lokiarchaeota archaeon]
MVEDFNLKEHVFFFGIGRYQANDTFFNWESMKYPKSSYFELKLTRNAPAKNEFYCVNRDDVKLVYYVHGDTDAVFTIGARPIVQSQTLEALIEHLIEQFFDMYDSSLLYSCYGDTCHIFNAFDSIIKNALENFKKLDLVKFARVNCSLCQKTIVVIVKKSIIENSKKTTIPFVYVHSGHSILIYFDRNFKIRGSEFVTLSY